MFETLGRAFCAAGIAAAIALCLGGCSSLSAVIEKPKVTLHGVKVQNPDLQGATLVFALNVENPNPIALQVDQVSYDVEVAGKALTSGLLEKGARVPAKSSAVIEVPIPVKYKELFASVMQVLKNPVTPYRLKGSAKMGLFDIPFESKGEVNVSKAD